MQTWTVAKRSFTSQAYEFFRCKGRHFHWSSIVWANTSTPKHCFIFWLVARNRLPTRDKLHFVISDLSCLMCGVTTETQDHLLFQCSLARQVWRRVLNWLCILDDFFSLKDLICWSLRHARIRSLRTKCIKATFACTIYCLWYSRNRKIFEDQVASAQDVVHRIITHVYRSLG